jgi:ABC transporter substrate binding protein
VLRDSAIAAGPGLLGAIQAPASSLGIELRPVDLRDAGQIERSVAAFAQQGSNGGLVVTGHPTAVAHRELIIALAARHRLPAVSALAELALKHRLPAMYGHRDYVEAGGLMSYGADIDDLNRRTALYIDKILKGAKPADLPVEQASKYQLAINLKIAKALGLEIPPTLLARADEVIE